MLLVHVTLPHLTSPYKGEVKKAVSFWFPSFACPERIEG